MPASAALASSCDVAEFLLVTLSEFAAHYLLLDIGPFHEPSGNKMLKKICDCKSHIWNNNDSFKRGMEPTVTWIKTSPSVE